MKVTMGVAFAPELAEAIKESAERQGLSVDGWIVAAAGLKFRADDEAEALGEAERKRRLALWHEAAGPWARIRGGVPGIKAVAVGCWPGGYDGGVRQTRAKQWRTRR